MTEISSELLGETIVTLERVGCQSHYYCNLPSSSVNVLHTMCFVCETLAKLKALLLNT